MPTQRYTGNATPAISITRPADVVAMMPLGFNLLDRRPSRLPLFMACPGSHRISLTVPVQSTADDAARLGRAVHVCMAHWIGGMSYEDALHRAATANLWAGVPADDARYLFREGVRMYQSTSQYFPAPENGVEIIGTEYKGTDDVHCIGEDFLAVGDWKFGWGLHDWRHQVMGYLDLLDQKYPGRSRLYGFVWAARHDHIQRIQINQEGLQTWRAEYQEAKAVAESGTAVYRINEHCENCSQLHGCPAIFQAAAGVGRFGGYQPGQNLLRNVQQARYATKAIRRACDAVDAATVALVDNAGGMLALPDGVTLERRLMWRKGYLTSKAIPVLREIFGPGIEDDIARITTAGIRRAIEQRFPDRPVQAVLASVMERLALADALTEYPTTSIRTLTQGADDATQDSGDAAE